MTNQPSDEQLIEKIKKDDQRSLDYLFRRYYGLLVMTAIKYVIDKFVAEEIVQDLFLNLWQKRKTLSILGKVKTYLLIALKNRCFNYLKSKYARQEFVEATDTNLGVVPPHDFTDNLSSTKEMLNRAIARLPEKCRHIFLLSRRGGMSYQEIAEELSISKKTVETQMGIALKRLREFMKEHQNNERNFQGTRKK